MEGKGQASMYHRMPNSSDSNVQWSVSLNANQDGCVAYLYTITGDTFIKGFKYNKIQKVGAEYFPKIGCDFNQPVFLINKYAGAYREDTSSRKVYFLRESDTLEKLLYNFDYAVGDTLKTYNAQWCNLVVERIDSVFIDSDYRKKWIIKGASCARNLEIIEGIGSNYGLFEEYAQPIGGRYVLGCFSINNKTLYPNYNPNAGCPMVNKIRNIENRSIFAINPNPSNGRFKIESTVKSYSITIMTLYGEIVLETKSISDIDISFCPAGIYYLKFSTDKISITQKIVLK